MNRVTIVDFGAGNLLSVMRAFRHLGAKVELASDAGALLAAERLVLPGVGAFGACMDGLRSRGLIPAVRDFAICGRPFLGICVGLQMLFEESEEFGRHEGLGLISGQVRRIPACGADGAPHKVPHIGWNALCKPGGTAWAKTPLSPLAEGVSVYFVHSFAAVPSDPRHLLAVCDYDGVPLTAAVRKDNVTGCQFHPEKSGQAGLSILKAFLESPP